MPNRVWQAEEKKWEKKLLRAQQALAHIRELRRLEAEEEEEERPASAPAGQVVESPGPTVESAGQAAAPLPPAPPREKKPITSGGNRPTARDTVPDLLKGGARPVKMLADTLGLSNQAVANALNYLKEKGVVVEEPSTFKGFRFQYRLATEDERRMAVVSRESDAARGGESMT